MATRLRNLDRDTPMLLPPDLHDWIPGDHIVHFLIDAVEALPCEYFRFNTRGTGDEQYPRPPVPPPEEPPDNKQYNFTDPESRIMKAGGNNFEQAFNAQAAVDA